MGNWMKSMPFCDKHNSMVHEHLHLWWHIIWIQRFMTWGKQMISCFYSSNIIKIWSNNINKCHFLWFFGTKNFQLHPLSSSKHKHLFLTKKLAVATVSCINPHSCCSQQDHQELHNLTFFFFFFLLLHRAFWQHLCFYYQQMHFFITHIKC